MRLTSHEIEAIRECAVAHFGEGTVVRLFGSRTNDALRGGDIDLHIVAPDEETCSPSAEWRFKDALYDRIGEQRIDTIVQPRGFRPRPIDYIAMNEGIVL